MYLHSWKTRTAERSPAQSRAEERLEDIRPYLEMARAAGCRSLREIAAFLNAAGLCGARGGPWCASQVLRTFRNLEQYDARSQAGRGPVNPIAIYQKIHEARSAGYTSLREIARFLTANGILTPRGNPWNAMQISRVIRRENQVRAEHS